MSLGIVSPGSMLTLEVRFDKSDFTNTLELEPAKFSIYDPARRVILQGSGEQDPKEPTRWLATVTIPDSLPITNITEKYVLVWRWKKQTITELFNVMVADDNLFVQTDRILMKGQSLYDQVLVPLHLVTPTMNLKAGVYGINSNLIAEFFPEQTGTIFDKAIFSIRSDALSQLTTFDNLGQPYALLWSYEIENLGPQIEIHYIYIIDFKALNMMNMVRKQVDKALNQDINPNLQIKEIDLVHYLTAGLNYINSRPPAQTNYTIGSAPHTFTDIVVKSAIMELSRAQYLAEGVSAFDFSGQAVSLTVDRSQYWDNLANQMQGMLDSIIPSIKAAAIKGSSGGVLGVSFGVTTNNFRRVSDQLTRLAMTRQQ